MNLDGNVMRKVIAFLLLWLAAFISLCVPVRKEAIRAIPENLATYTPGGWHGKVTSHEVLPFERSRHGLLGSCLIIDRGVGHDHWSAAIDPVMLLVYATGAVVPALLILHLLDKKD